MRVTLAVRRDGDGCQCAWIEIRALNGMCL